MAEEARQAQFGTAAIKLGLVTRAQVDECVSIQTQMKSLGIAETLGEILVKKGYLTPVQQSQVLKTMGVDVSPIPGYKLLAKLGQGAMGTVYKAQHLKMNRTVALKVIKAELAKDPEFLQRFFREARAAAKLTHPNIISAFDVAEAAGVYYFVMEYVEGQPLSAVLRKSGRLPVETAVQYLLQAARALDCIAQHGMVHRDVKPENLMITKEGTVKLCDFGLAKEVEENVSLTMTGWTMGTPLYMSPEQIRGQKDIDIRADVYSLGATLFTVLCGRPPFVGENPGEVVSKHLTQAVPSIRKLTPGVPEDLARIVEKCLRKKREERYATPGDLAADLERFAAGEKPLAASMPPPGTRRVGTSRRFPVALAAGAAALVLVIALFFVFRRKTEPAPSNADAMAKAPRPPTEEDLKASELIARADELLRAENWAPAVEALEELTTRYRETEPVSRRRGDLTRKLADARLKSEGAVQARQEKLRKAKGHVELEEWVKAEELLRDLDSDPEVLELLKTCKSEVQCRTDVEAARGFLNAGSWDKAARAIQEILAKHAETRTLGPLRPGLESDLESCKSEMEAAAALERVWSLEVEKRWDELLKTIREVEEKYGRSRSYLAVTDRIRALKGQGMRVQAEAVRRDADALWARAAGAMKSEDFKGAQALFEEYRKNFGEADFFEGRRAELEAQLAACADKIRLAREREAESKNRDGESLVTAKKYEEAAAAFHDLLEDYRETDYVRKNGKRLELRIKDCERSMGKAASGRFFEDFSNGVGKWTAQQSAGVQTQIAVVPKGRDGKNALQMTMPGGDAKTKYAFANVGLPISGFSSDVIALRFWVKLSKGAKMTLAFDLTQPHPMGNSMLTFRNKFEATSEWRQVTIELSKMEILWYAQGDKPAFDRTRATRLAFARSDYTVATTTPQQALTYTGNDPLFEFVILLSEIEIVRKK